ncbi:hypothetical protein DFJ74DRAFT_728932, partial [Hyaloraphidium curvatum]
MRSTPGCRHRERASCFAHAAISARAAASSRKKSRSMRRNKRASTKGCQVCVPALLDEFAPRARRRPVSEANEFIIDDFRLPEMNQHDCAPQILLIVNGRYPGKRRKRRSSRARKQRLDASSVPESTQTTRPSSLSRRFISSCSTSRSIQRLASSRSARLPSNQSRRRTPRSPAGPRHSTASMRPFDPRTSRERSRKPSTAETGRPVPATPRGSRRGCRRPRGPSEHTRRPRRGSTVSSGLSPRSGLPAAARAPRRCRARPGPAPAHAAGPLCRPPRRHRRAVRRERAERGGRGVSRTWVRPTGVELSEREPAVALMRGSMGLLSPRGKP